MEQLRAKVKLAASYLDENDPGWAERIDTETLDMFSGHNCIGGQLYPNERHAWERLRSDVANATGESMAGVFSAFILQSAWVEEIKQRVQDPIQTAINNGGGDPRLETEPVEA